MSTISMLYLYIQCIVGAPREGKGCCAIEWVFLNCIYNFIWVPYQCIWEEDRVRTQHIPVVGKERFNMDCSLHFLCLDHQHHFPNQLCLDLLTRSTHRPQRSRNHSVYIQSSERSLEGELCFLPHWPESSSAGQLLQGGQLTTQALLRGWEGTVEPLPLNWLSCLRNIKAFAALQGCSQSFETIPISCKLLQINQ